MTPDRPHVLIVPFMLPSLNEIIAAAKQRSGRWSAYATMKRQHQRSLVSLIHAAHLRCFTTPIWLHFNWHEPSRRRDPDNVAAGGRKIILDALVVTGIIADDGWQHVAGWTDQFSIRRPGGVVVELREAA